MSLGIPRPSPADAALPVLQPVPSGQEVELFEVLIDAVETESWLRFRFLAPAIGAAAGGLAYEAVQGDFGYLCAEVALPYMEQFALTADVVSIALLDRPVVFGESDPESTQYIETFRVEGATCVEEGSW